MTIENVITVLFLSLVIISSILPFIKKENKKIVNCPYNIIALAYLIIYGIAFPLNYFLTFLGYNSPVNTEIYMGYNPTDFLISYGLIFLFIHITLFIFRKQKFFSRSIICSDEKKQKNRKEKIILISAVLLFIVGFIANEIYLDAYGGFVNYLNYSAALRSGIITIDNPFSFLMPFRSCVIFSSYLFARLLRGEKKKMLSLIFLVISVIISFSILYSNDGRIGILIYIILLYLAIRSKGIKKYISVKSIVKVFAFSIVSVFLVVSIGVILNRNGSENILLTFNSEISFPFLNIKRIIDYCSFDNYRYFFDTISFIIYILPSSLWRSWGIITSSDINTMAWTGWMKGENGVYGEIPIDIVSLSFIQLGIIGFWVIPMVYAYCYSVIYKYICRIKQSVIFPLLFYYFILVIGVQTMIYADPYLFITRNFGIIIFGLIYAVIVNFSKRRTARNDNDW